MNNYVFKVLYVSSFFICTFVSNIAFASLVVIADNKIPYLAMGKGDAQRSIKIYNPTLCKEVPGPCKFFIEHIHAHDQMNHLILPPEAYPPTTEAIADCFVAKNGEAQDVLDTYELLLQPDEAAKYAIPGDLQVRAEHIKACAIKANNWVGK